MRESSLVLLCVVLLASCGGGGGGDNGGGGGGGAVTYTIGGTVSGLAGDGLVLHNNGGNSLTVSANGPFTFSGALAGGSTYNATVGSQPTNPWQTCAVTNGGSGTVGSANVTGVQVSCTTNTYTIGGTVTGLHGTGLVLRNNGGDDLAVADEGAIVFATSVASGASYEVTVHTQPTAAPAETCEIEGGAGTVTNAAITGVTVSCRTLVGRFAYVANSGSKTISGFAIDAQTGELLELSGSPFPVNGAGPLAPMAHPSASFLYILGDDTLGDQGETTLTGYSVDADTGALAPIPGMPIIHPAGASPIRNPEFHPSGKFLYLAISEAVVDADNGLYAYAVDTTTGELTAIAGSPYKLGTTLDHNIRGAMTGTNGEFLYVLHGVPPTNGEITAFAIDSDTGALILVGAVPLGKYANQLAIHPSGDFIYTRNADSSTSILGIDSTTGQLSPPVSVAAAYGTGIAFALDGRYVYYQDTGNVPPDAGTGRVLGFEVDEATGALSPLPQSPYATNGETALAFVIDPTSRYLAATNFGSGTIAVFAIDQSNGSLSHIAGSPFAPTVAGNQGGVFFDPSGRFAYLPSALPTGGSISSYRIDEATGLPLFVGSQPTGVGTSGINVAIFGLQ